jgi:hypothetical protein
MTSQERKRDENQLNITVSPGTSAPENIRSHTHTHWQKSFMACLEWLAMAEVDFGLT